MFSKLTIRNSNGYPELVGSGKFDMEKIHKSLKYRTFAHYDDVDVRLILADNLDDVVRFFGIVTSNKHGYDGACFDINLDGVDTLITGPWSSRESAFNTPNGEVAIVRVAVDYLEMFFKLKYLQKEIARLGCNIGFMKCMNPSGIPEFYYSPCYCTPAAISEANRTRTGTLLEYIKPNGEVIPASIQF